MERAWGKLLELPAYRDVGSLNGIAGVFRYMREQPRELDDMMTEGTERHEAMTRWLEKLRGFSQSIMLFQDRTNKFLGEYADDLRRRTPEAYATMYGQYRFDMEQAWDWADQVLTIEEDALSPEELLSAQDHMSAERTTFEDLTGFLYVDFIKGLAAGHIPQWCLYCEGVSGTGRWSLRRKSGTAE